MSASCLLDIILPLCFDKSLPQCSHLFGLQEIILSGVFVWFRVFPLCPFCPPDFFPLRSLKVWFFLGGKLSLDGGLELLLLFFCNCFSNSCTLLYNCIIIPIKSSFSNFCKSAIFIYPNYITFLKIGKIGHTLHSENERGFLFPHKPYSCRLLIIISPLLAINPTLSLRSKS